MKRALDTKQQKNSNKGHTLLCAFVFHCSRYNRPLHWYLSLIEMARDMGGREHETLFMEVCYTHIKQELIPVLQMLTRGLDVQNYTGDEERK